ncbi:ATP synthase F0 subunit B [Chryseobacterium sp.]|uniref:ATP synthase F0 subunit B n=1 Tax=Chryseobacterium sp. TaxID=1871047 RepID=UPI0011CA699A|nr:ATP synthase F0 subunit B [Chryseobacterium sp.]TXF79486.1 ATP synthase F0 subunit B [Chryseobacterium sp.]
MTTNTQPSQTLFRFVSLRSPQLSDDQGQDKRFIFAPDQLRSTHFYQHVLSHPGETKSVLLKNYAVTYEQSGECIRTQNELQTNYPVLYEFATWVARNRTDYNDDELREKADQLRRSFPPDQPEVHLLLWNNLIYQAVTQKNFYIKETVMHMLLALQIALHIDQPDLRTAAHARVVLPRDLMMDDDGVLPIGLASRLPAENTGSRSYPSESMVKQQKVAEAKALLSRYEKLEKDLYLTEKKYRKAYQQEYQAQKDQHQAEIQPIIEQYQQDIENERIKYCGVRNPEIPYHPEDPCNQPAEIPFPNLPDFAFEFRPEVEGSDLESSLPAQSVETILQLLGHDFSGGEIPGGEVINQLLAGRDSFTEMHALIKEGRDLAGRIISEHTDDNADTFTSIGGVLLPVSRIETVPFMYQLCSKTIVRMTSIDLSLDVPDASWDVIGAAYTANLNSGALSGTYFVKNRVGNRIFLNNLFATAATDGAYFPQTGSFTIDIQLTFSNGKTTSFNVPIDSLKLCYSSSFEFTYETEDPASEPEDAFIPSGFGFRQIGIADYLKVEQSTHAYVEGEVAHIENVMAREYREKSTRRLRRSENTTTSSSDTERETLTDTTSSTRFEMQSEIAKMLQEATDVSTYGNFGLTWGTKPASYSMNVGATYAHHSSKEESIRQAVTQAQEITARALDRVVTKVHEERTVKIIEEFEENNRHGFDNTKGNKHVVGVFRWVDQLMKNQIYNYGKRMMFEFMVPQPAKLHTLGMTMDQSAHQTTLVKPADPRESLTMPMKDYSALENEAVLKYWSGKYNVELDQKPENEIRVTKSISVSNGEIASEMTAKSDSIDVPEGYTTSGGWLNISHFFHPDRFEWTHISATVGDFYRLIGSPWSHIVMDQSITFKKKYSDKVGFAFESSDSAGVTMSVSLDCTITPELKNLWLQKTFHAIISAYEDALAEYTSKLAEEQATGIEIKGSNPGFYRQIENMMLRKNCISYMIDRTTDSTHGYGMSGLTAGSAFTDYETQLTARLDQYTAFLKFMEQAFEWENLSYNLYPYYWANRTEWVNLYQAEDTDPLFRAFLQSGMARVIVTVRPGFENAVQLYLATGKIWNGGEIPVIGDELYLSLVDELRAPKGEKQGKAWITRLPTPLTILQADSIGLTVEHALPFTDENPDEFEIPSEVITESHFELETDVLLETGNGTADRIALSGDQLALYSGNELLSTLPIGDLVNAERQADNLVLQDDRIMLKFHDEEIASIPLEELKARMGI